MAPNEKGLRKVAFLLAMETSDQIGRNLVNVVW